MKKLLLIIISFMIGISSISAAELEYNIKSFDHAKEIISFVYSGKAEAGDYKLILEENVNGEEIVNYINSLYTSPYEKNMFKYDEYAKVYPSKRNVAELIDNTITFNNNFLIITEEEQNKVDEYAKTFIDDFKDKRDDQKIYAVYSYLTHIMTYPTEFGHTYFVEAYKSSYDALFTHIVDCVGVSNTFQYFMEKMGIESYIVVRANTDQSEGFSSVHNYNVVKLENKWYIVDIQYKDDFTGFLIGMNENYINDTYSAGITISDTSYDYQASKIDVDYEKYFKESDEEEVSLDSTIEYIFFVLILIIVLLVIILFSIRK